MDLFTAIATVDLLHLLAMKARGETIDPLEASLVLFILRATNPVTIMFFISAAIAFTVWIGAADANLRFFGAGSLEFEPRDARAAFFIPFINLYRPPGVLQEIWRASDPCLPRDDRGGWQSAPKSKLIPLWWGMYLTGGIVSLPLLSLGRSHNRSDVHLTIALLFVVKAINAAAAALAIALVVIIQKRQRERRRVA